MWAYMETHGVLAPGAVLVFPYCSVAQYHKVKKLSDIKAAGGFGETRNKRNGIPGCRTTSSSMLRTAVVAAVAASAAAFAPAGPVCPAPRMRVRRARPRRAAARRGARPHELLGVNSQGARRARRRAAAARASMARPTLAR